MFFANFLDRFGPAVLLALGAATAAAVLAS